MRYQGHESVCLGTRLENWAWKIFHSSVPLEEGYTLGELAVLDYTTEVSLLLIVCRSR